MSTVAYTRKKEPVAVRKALLSSAARLAASDGLAAVTVQSVAAAAGVTKGGLFHHFPSKADLVAAMFQEQLALLDATIEELMASDCAGQGRFTRAYVKALLADGRFAPDSQWGAVAAAVVADRTLRSIWSRWLDARLTRHADTDASLAQEAIRLAADGAWFSHLTAGSAVPRLPELVTHLLAATLRPLDR